MAKVYYKYSKNYFIPDKLGFQIDTYPVVKGLLNWHCHDFFEMTFILEGQGTHKTLHDKQWIRKGWCHFININEPHAIKADEDMTMINILFTQSFFKDIVNIIKTDAIPNNLGLELFYKNKSRGYSGFFLSPENFLSVYMDLKELMDEFGRKGNRYESFIRVRFALFILKLARLSERSDRPRQGEDSGHTQGKILRIKEYVQQNFMEKITLESAALLCGYNPSYFSRFFKKFTNYNLIEYVNEVRITKACEMLAEKNIPITEAALNVGIRSISLFNRIFKKSMGITPRGYRKMVLKVKQSN